MSANAQSFRNDIVREPVLPHPVLREEGRDARGHVLTPTQAALHAARRARLARMSEAAARLAAAKAPPAPVTELVPEPEPSPVLACAEPQVPIVPAMPDPLAQALSMPHKAPWFRIEGERDADQGPEIRDIQQLVCLRYGVTLSDLLSPRRPASIVRPRQVAVYLARELTMLSLPQIGAKFGGRDHTTVLVTHRKIGRLLASDAKLASEVAGLRATLMAPTRIG